MTASSNDGQGKSLFSYLKELVRDHQSRIPEKSDELLSLKGVGKYTAGRFSFVCVRPSFLQQSSTAAIASIAFDERVGVVDGNVIRVLSRLLCIGSNPKAKETQKTYWGECGTCGFIVLINLCNDITPYTSNGKPTCGVRNASGMP